MLPIFACPFTRVRNWRGRDEILHRVVGSGAAIVAHWLDREDCLPQLMRFPISSQSREDRLAQSGRSRQRREESLYVVARGPSLPIATETALKLKETCAIHAEAYSIAEVMHGPLELLGEGFPGSAYRPKIARGNHPVTRSTKCARPGPAFWWPRRAGFPFVRTSNSLLDPISMIQTAYRFVEATAVARGRNPDRPRLLKKVTETV